MYVSKRFISIVVLFISFLSGVSVMAESFTKVKHPNRIVKELVRLPDLVKPRSGSYTKKSPLIATLFAEQVGNQIEIKVHISNPNAFEWFIKNERTNDAAIDLVDAKGRFLGYYHSISYDDTPFPDTSAHTSVYLISDEDYDLLKPGKSVELYYSLSAKKFFDLSKEKDIKDIYITYTNGGTPPSISEALTDRYFVGKVSNAARIRCHHYDEDKKQYLCEVEVLPGQP